MPERKVKIMKQYLAQNYVGMDYHKRDQHLPFEFDTCLYTTSKTDDFMIDTHPKNSNIVVCGACNGHAFKFAPLIGRMALELLQDSGRSTFSLNVNNRPEGINRDKFALKNCLTSEQLTSKL
jgi:hypothetical protein